MSIEVMKQRMKVGYTGWFSWPAIYCKILEINGDKYKVECAEGQIGIINASDFTPMYLRGAGQEGVEL